MSNQYSFFDTALSERFLAFAQAHGIAGGSRPDPIEGVLVDLPDDLPDDLLDALEAEYDHLMDQQQALIDGADEGDALMGVTVDLPDGTPCLVSIPAALGHRLMAHFSTDEIHALVSAIAGSVADPSMTPLCCRTAD